MTKWVAAKERCYAHVCPMVVTVPNFDSCVHTALRKVIQSWPSLCRLVTSCDRACAEVNTPSRHFYKDKWTKFIIPVYDHHNYLGTWKDAFLCKTEFWRSCIEKSDKHLHDIEWFSECTWESGKRWCSFRQNATFRRPTRYTERDVFTYVRFLVVTKSVYVPPQGARLINKAKWGVNQHFKRHWSKRYVHTTHIYTKTLSSD